MKYTKELLEEACKNSYSIYEAIRYMGGKTSSGGTWHWIKRKIEMYDIDTSHFTGRGHAKGKDLDIFKKMPAKKILVNDRLNGRKEKTNMIVRSLLEIGRSYKCVKCGNTGKWQGEKLVLEVNHINGNSLDNRRNNLEFKCPSCHSQDPIDYNQPRKDYGNCKDCNNKLKRGNKSGYCYKCWARHMND